MPKGYNLARGAKKLSQTEPGAVDDDATSRALKRKREMERRLAEAAGDDMNPIDAASEELEYDEPESVRRVFEN
jgi:hypothetical protein